jgi:predicted DNA-binding protein YlxM (UPF0122 family)
MRDFKKIKNRSDHYQAVLLEISYPHELLDIFSDTDSIYKKLNPFSYNDGIAELQEALNKELWRIIEDNLTERQRQVVKLYASGKTQIEIAKQLGVNQSSITKCLNGNVDYKNKDLKGKPITYGGVRLKLQKIVKDDVKVNEILQQIADLRDNDPF